MKKIIFLIILCLGSFNLEGQNNPTLLEDQKIVPISPNAASLGVYGAIPVGHYNGTANISVPLFDIVLDGKKIPVNLSYRSSGIKVAQEASIVGLGWVLNLGGCITREVKGWDDFCNNNVDPTGYYYNELPHSDFSNYWDTEWNKYLDFSNNKQDPEPDIFHFNFASFSGTMFFNKINKNGNTLTCATPIVRKEENYLKIEFNPKSSVWTIWDLDGFQYIFKTNETTKMYSASSSTYNPKLYTRSTLQTNPRVWEPDVISAWYLDEIISPLNNKVKFTYTEENIVTPINIHEDVSYLVNTSIFLTSTGYSQFLCDHFNYDYKYYSYNYSQITQRKLYGISFPEGEISLKYSSRFDIEPATGYAKPEKLDDIFILDKNRDIARLIQFDYSYMGETSHPESCRLILDKLKVNDQNYLFAYNKGVLPDKNSSQVDYWGYAIPHNKQTTSTHRDFELSPPVVYDNTYFGGLERAANEDFSKYGILESITFPTGGKTVFEYELNTFDDDGSLPSSVQQDIVRNDLTWISYSYMQGPNQSPYSDEFTISGEKKKVTFKINAKHLKQYETSQNSRKSYDVHLHIEKKGGWPLFQSVYFYYNHLPNPYGTEIEEERSVELSPGTYRIYFVNENIIENQFPFEMRAYVFDGYKTISTEVGGGTHRKKGCGLRVKKVTDYSDNDKYVEKKYAYTTLSGSQTGILMVPPVFHTRFRLVGLPPGIQISLVPRLHQGTPARDMDDKSYVATYLRGTSNPYIPFAGSEQYVGYSSVIERTINSGVDNGSTIYAFHNNRSTLQNDPYFHSYVPNCPSKPDLNNGSPLSISYIDDKGILKMKKNFKYKRSQAETIRGLNIYIAPMANDVYHSNSQFKHLLDRISYSTTFYNLSSERWFLENTTDTTYFNNGRSSGQSIDFKYHPINLLQNYNKQIINGDIYEKYLKYPIDFTDDINQGMTSKKMSGVLIESIDLKNEKVISAQRRIYKDTLGFYLPHKIQKIDIASPVATDIYSKYYIDEFHYSLYYKQGNILQKTTKDKISTVYLWSYNNQYPIAEIQNATYEQINKLIDIDALSKKAEPFAADWKIINDLRSNTALPNAMVTTYTYKPLVGILTSTDPRGITTYYQYDTFGRLEATYIGEKDASGKEIKRLLHQYDYHYQNQ